MEIFEYLSVTRLGKRLETARLVVICGITCLCNTTVQPSSAQGYSPYPKAGDPNLQHFYMGRQEIEVIDNTPIIKYRGGDGGQQGGSVPGPQPLPAAGFQQYSSNVHGGPLNLPKVENGVPRKVAAPNSSKGGAAKLKVKSSAQAGANKTARSAAPVIKTYKQNYQTRPPQPVSSGAVEPNSTQKVHGKLLPFATTRRRSNY